MNLTRGERSALHCAMLSALGASPGEPKSPEESARQAYAEAVALHDDPAQILNMADAIADHVFAAVYDSDCNFALVDPSPLLESWPDEIVDCAIRIAGYRRTLDGRQPGKQRYTDAPAGEPCAKVTLPRDLFEGGE
ncbi:hypothetical protein [Pseudoruegeria sp. HB172150]|uniref:hypothetical protein n=1 Tax=Pseudoruegeria sp. HB172150 TaxID=2721164 RepID=UPI0015539013|nr:hypothetical protein [Pseudoruegeria sp. HB172150]